MGCLSVEGMCRNSKGSFDELYCFFLTQALFCSSEALWPAPEALLGVLRDGLIDLFCSVLRELMVVLSGCCDDFCMGCESVNLFLDVVASKEGMDQTVDCEVWWFEMVRIFVLFSSSGRVAAEA